MAIKTVSQLEAFENDKPGQDGSSNHGKVGVGRNLAFFQDGYLTNADKGSSMAVGGSDYVNITGGKAYSTGLNPNKFAVLEVADSSTYWSSLFEISQPERASQVNAQNEPEFRSYSIQYEDILKNVLWDVKSYLNFRNHLNDYDLCSIVEGDQYFRGKKYVVGGLSVSEALSSNNLTANNLTANNLTAMSKLSVGCNISADTRERGFDGYAFGLMDRDASVKLNVNSKTNVGTYNTTANSIMIGVDSSGQSLKNQAQRTGDPVMFKDGRPYELTAVNYATSAFNLVDPDQNAPWNVGNGVISSVNGVQNSYSSVFFRNGKPQATNIIDFSRYTYRASVAILAYKAYWADLGERYLADNSYEPGTLVKFGGEKEITIADDEVNAVVSTKAFELNCNLENGTVIALCGRVPTKVKGKIKKFEKMMLSDTPGVACVWDGKSRVIGRALESNDNEEVKLVECVTKFQL